MPKPIIAYNDLDHSALILYNVENIVVLWEG